MIMVLLSSTHKCIIYYIIIKRDNIAVFSVSTDNSLSHSFLNMSLISGYRIIPLLYHVIKKQAYHHHLVSIYPSCLIEDDKYHWDQDPIAECQLHTRAQRVGASTVSWTATGQYPVPNKAHPHPRCEDHQNRR